MSDGYAPLKATIPSRITDRVPGGMTVRLCTLAKGQLLDSYAVVNPEDGFEARARHRQIRTDLDLPRFEFVVVLYHGETGGLIKTEPLQL